MSEFLELLGDFANVPDDKSIMLDELEFFWYFSKSYRLDRIIESGTYKGLTAKRLSLLYPKCQIISFEKRKERFLKIPKEHHSPNIEYKHGELDRTLLTNSTAVIIDGPKRMGAFILAYKCKKIVPFVAIHDMFEYRNILCTLFETVVFKGDLAICS